VPVAVEILIALIVPGIVFLCSNLMRYRERMRVLDVVQVAVQGGNPLSPETIAALPGGGHMFPTAQRDFRMGVLLVASGAALAVMGLCVAIAVAAEGGPAVAVGVSIAAAGAIPACIGIALVVLSRSEKRVVES
jgi:hypothetical protein